MSTELKYKVMDDEVRMEIARLYKDGWKVGDIADAVGLHETSVYRELNRGMTDKLDANGRFEYDIDKARLDAARARANKGKFKGIGVDGRCKRRARLDWCGWKSPRLLWRGWSYRQSCAASWA